MFKLEKNKEYEIRFMPNFKADGTGAVDFKQSHELLFTTISENPHLAHRYFSIILRDGVLDVMMYGHQIKAFLEYAMTGFVGTSEGYFLTNTGVPEFYFANKDKSKLKLELNPNDDENEFHKHYDIVEYSPFNLFDIQSGIVLTAKTRDTRFRFMEIFNIGIKNVAPIWKPGDDKQKIEFLWDDAPSIKETIEEYKKQLTEENEKSFFLWEDEAKRYFWWHRKKTQSDRTLTLG